MEKGSVVIRRGKDMERNLMIHLPFWGRDARVFRNQMEQKVKQHQGYVQLSPCRKGEEIRLELPVRLRLVTNEENDHLVNLACGPYLLAAISDSREFLELPPLDQFRPDGQPFHFMAKGLKFVPFPEVDLEPAHLYFKR